MALYEDEGNREAARGRLASYRAHKPYRMGVYPGRPARPPWREHRRPPPAADGGTAPGLPRPGQGDIPSAVAASEPVGRASLPARVRSRRARRPALRVYPQARVPRGPL